MKITGFSAAVIEFPPAAPMFSPPEYLRTSVVLSLRTDDGVEGFGLTFYGASLTPALKTAVEKLAELSIGEDPLRVEAIIKKIQAATGSAGPAGLYLLALSAVDLALWDIRCKALGLPLWKLVGGAKQRMPAYASTMLRRGDPLDQLTRIARGLVADGYRELKMQLALPGDTSPRREVECAQAIRDAVGPDVKLMCDINQRWRADEAIDMGRRLEPIGLAWLEDVTTHDDYAGLARVAAALSTPVCGGEAVYGITPFRRMLELQSVDIVMIDLWRVGGITQWLKVAGMAEAFNIPVVNHLLAEVHVHLVAGIPNGLTVECSPWMNGLFEEPAQPVAGELAPSSAPGIGIKFSSDVLRKLRG